MYGLTEDEHNLIKTIRSTTQPKIENNFEEYQILQDTELSILPDLFQDTVNRVTSKSPTRTLYSTKPKAGKGMELWEICDLPTQIAKLPRSVEIDITKEIKEKATPPTISIRIGKCTDSVENDSRGYTNPEREKHDNQIAKWRQARNTVILVSVPKEHSKRLQYKNGVLHYRIGIIGDS